MKIISEKAFAKILPALAPVCCALLLGAAQPAPVLATQGFYINDYAGLIAQEYRDAMLLTSQELYEKTGCQLVALTVESIAAGSAEDGADYAADYAAQVFEGWGVGGPQGKGALLFLTEQQREARLYAGAGISDGLLLQRLEYVSGQIAADLARREYGRGIYNGFFDVADELFFHYGATRQTEKPEFRGTSVGGPLEYGAIFVIAALIILRGWNIMFRSGNRQRKNAYTYKRHEFPNRVRGLVYNSEKGEYEETPRELEEPDDLPSGFGGAVTVKEHLYEDKARPERSEPEPDPATRDFWKAQWDEFEDESGGRN